ncbi:dolichyl-phosphate-mannose-protein mannosyltransferase [Longilinea arvoryzae]|uniref:Dolichyl-phosphate-mannose-protein mannosyltransferase n=1 Tax=Longilinea arvoryzae TaxID=360412 RepID=A0A0S7B829_9CHLR|nr:glycosyltransferase family 39 protein [Longilinea arvoryzae]GAP13479.1 dolichyl-phosphate-mannose-protein mannosyltransferase [Longilinea arvoryzae]
MRNFIKHNLLILILGLAVLLRVAAAVYMGDTVQVLPGTSDQVSYHNLALRVLGGHGFSFGENWWPATRANEPTAHWSFLYTLYLVGVYALFGPHPLVARLIQAVIVGLLQPWLTYLLGKQLFNARVGLWAAFLNAIYAYFIYYGGTLMTEPFYITAILGALLLAIRLVQPPDENTRRGLLAVGLGLLLGAAVLLRQLFLLFIPFLLLWMFWASLRRHSALKWVHYVLPLAVVAAMIAPITIYNAQRFGQFVLLNTNSGYAFYWGNHPYYGTHFQPILSNEEYQQLLPQDQLNLDEAALDKELLRRGMQFVLEDPGRYALLSLSRIPAYFEFLPSSDSGTISNLSRVLSFGILWPFMLAGLIMAWRKRSHRFWDALASPKFLLVLFALVYTVIHVLTWTLIRYRLPVDATLLVFAGVCFDGIAVYLFQRKKPAG